MIGERAPESGDLGMAFALSNLGGLSMVQARFERVFIRLFENGASLTLHGRDCAKKHNVVTERWSIRDPGESANHLTFEYIYERICRGVCLMGKMTTWV